MLKKQLIMQKAVELFAEQGFEATSVQQITDRCGISKGAFYLSFKSKDELILALIDQFMTEIITDIDSIVKSNKSKDELLFDFFYINLSLFEKYSDYAKTFMQEQLHLIKEEFIEKMHYYNLLNEKTILELVERVYGDHVQDIKYDLVYCIKGFIRIYTELFFVSHTPPDFEKLSHSLVEKTNLLAKHTKLPFITAEYAPLLQSPKNNEISKEKIVEVINQNLEEVEQGIERESLILLRDQLNMPTLPRAIIKGLIRNIRQHPITKWTSYLLENYYD
ncbi:TetR/AcrR family transcriptional regulator [Mesobacillus maritimus]|uniref:TetR/AcrR family transcriptional regulator n=1 Tax=Mesobacillus maritimus TaxID=1643336 RepID=UPI00203EFF88|nr:TetR/AcrR family transcriptional regulator [Mesobacillus maritimus]MCM3586676.1 TetR/AcrR family transcriptional regulator [Mesobacillus maritimus]